MCRLLYVNSKHQFAIEDYLKKFALVARNSREFQGHGWGCAYQTETGWKFYHNVKPIWEDDLSKFGNTDRLIVHARSAFKDEGIVVENNMPFNDEKNIFIFNGELRGVKIKEDGRIGAEKIFNYIKRFDKGSIKGAISKGTEIINKKSNYVRAMNIIWADNEAAYVYAQFNEDADYFTMYKYQNKNTVAVCSEKFPDENDWLPIANNSLTEIPCY